MLKRAYRRIPHAGHPEHKPEEYDELKEFTSKICRVGELITDQHDRDLEIIEVIKHEEYKQTRFELILKLIGE